MFGLEGHFPDWFFGMLLGVYKRLMCNLKAKDSMEASWCGGFWGSKERLEEGGEKSQGDKIL